MKASRPDLMDLRTTVFSCQARSPEPSQEESRVSSFTLDITSLRQEEKV